LLQLVPGRDVGFLFLCLLKNNLFIKQCLSYFKEQHDTSIRRSTAVRQMFELTSLLPSKM